MDKASQIAMKVDKPIYDFLLWPYREAGFSSVAMPCAEMARLRNHLRELILHLRIRGKGLLKYSS